MHRFTPLLGLCVLLVACGKAPDDTKASADSTASASAPVQELAPGAPAPAATAPKGPALLRVKATVKDDTYKNAPSCMVTFTVENLHDRPLAVFSADFVPMQASTNKELTTATHFAGMSASAANLPLEPGASGQPWKQNILGTGCSGARRAGFFDWTGRLIYTSSAGHQDIQARGIGARPKCWHPSPHLTGA